MSDDTVILETAREVWARIRMDGGTDLERYDTELEGELRQRLGFPAGSLDNLLANYPVTVEAFVLAFFRCAQPFVDMMGDLLAMFEKAGATRGSQNLDVKFDFGEGHAGLRFDLRHFRQWIERWREALRLVETELWDYRSLWELNGVLRGGFNTLGNTSEMVTEPAVRNWMRAYRDGVMPQPLPPAPRTGFAELDSLLVRAWGVWTAVFEATAALAPDHETLMATRFEDESDNDGPRPVRELSRELLRNIQSDRWAGSFVMGGYAHVERIRALDATEQPQYVDELAAGLRDVFARVHTGQIEVPTLLRVLDDFLRLPLWERRYELYSAWVSTQIVASLDGYRVRVHHDDGVLSFSFSGTHLATCDTLLPRLHLWAEVRSPLEDPKGEGRKNAIQPDYTLLTDPVTGSRSAVLVVECKQYRRASATKFAAALDDYARGRPGARVVLVNYGPARPEIADRITEPEVRERVQVIGELRPGNPAALESLRSAVLDAVELRYPSASPPAPSRRTVTAPFEATLTWGAQPADLDLHLQIGGEPDPCSVTYSNRGRVDGFPWATYAGDAQNGYGPEQIEVHRLEDRPYRFAVHNYTGSGAPLAGCAARVTVTTVQGVMELECPASGEGAWWIVCTVDGATGEITEVNELAPALPPL